VGQRKISELPLDSNPTGSEELFVNDGGVSRRVAIKDAVANVPADSISGDKIDGGTLSGLGGAKFNDNSKATFGASGDLEIYHDGSNSYISDVGTGNLKLRGNSLDLLSAGNERYLTAALNGSVKLYNDDNEKLATTSTGVNVTGTVTADGLTVDGNSVVDFSRDGDGTIVRFIRANSVVGSVSVTSAGTTYNTTSDARMKTNVVSIEDGTERLMEMNPVDHNWVADPEGDTVSGFLAQEMKNVVPEAVSGDPDGEEMMSMDYGRITPILVAALQDAHKRIDELEKLIKGDK
jgi:hypothetical protein